MFPSVLRLTGLLLLGVPWAAAERPAGEPGTVGAAFAPAEHPHPRLLFPAAREDGLRERIASDPAAALLHAELLREAGEILDERTCRYEIPDGRRLLAESRRALHHIVQAGMAWRLTGEERFRERVLADLDAACGLPDWNPSHFLDVAEMAAAVAIGYDWLYPTLTAAQRARYEEALLTKALQPAQRAYRRDVWWSDGRNNWAQVCGAGIALAALAVWERDPDLCGSLVRSGVDLVERCGAFYRPDGVYAEGPGYWHYGTNYHVLLLAACEAVGIAAEVEPALEASGDFILEVAGPTGLDFNFADMRQSRSQVSPAQFWIARTFGNGLQSRVLRDRLRAEPAAAASGRLASLGLLWLPADPGPQESALRPLRCFDGEQPLAFFRNGRDPSAAWLAVKGGTGAVSHGHLDAGSFVYEAEGVRWFLDLGRDDYNLPGYFGDRRWEYFRLNNRSHNTLVIGGRLQEAPEQPCRIVRSGREDGTAWVEIDLGPAYAGQAASAVRRVEFDEDSGAVRLVDTLTNPVGPVRWAVMTDAQVELSGNRAVLRKAGRTLVLERPEGAPGQWALEAARPPTGREERNEGHFLLTFHHPPAADVVLEVAWAPPAR